ncbi:hypothetical protein TNCV_2008961 [Trichonephila clavipes]|nr:hypothetical protein TNCV_2008961 [Trichonephila clavipes]
MESVNVCYVRGIKVSPTFSPNEDSNSSLKKHVPIIVMSITEFFAFTITSLFSRKQLKRHIRLDAGRKGQSLQDGCRSFACKFFFQTQQQGHQQVI